MAKKRIYFTLLFVLSACSNSSATNTPIVTEVFLEEIGDGEASANVFTWEDINQNGIPEEGESAIPYVTTSILYPDILTDSEGHGTPTKFMPGCTENCFENETVYVKTPPGYKPTTPTSYYLTGENNNYLFGFYPEDKDNIISFPNEPEWQKAFINRGVKLIEFRYSDQGTLAITIDQEGTYFDEYFPKELSRDNFDFDFFLFDIILELNYSHGVNISETQVTIKPSNSIFLCQTNDVDNWDGRISGYEILMQKCRPFTIIAPPNTAS